MYSTLNKLQVSKLRNGNQNISQMLKGIQVMKTYLGELDRVQEVAKSFKTHYMTSLQVPPLLMSSPIFSPLRFIVPISPDPDIIML